MLGLSIEIDGQRMLIPTRECRRLMTVPVKLAIALTEGTVPNRVVIDGVAYALRLPAQHVHGVARVMRGSRLIELECDTPTVVFIELVTGLLDYSAPVGTMVVESGEDYLCSSFLTAE